MADHPFDRYFRKHGHYPRVRLDSGVQRVQVEFAPGYVHVKTYPYGGEVWIVRSTWFTLLKRLVPLTKAWHRHPDHDVPAALRASSDFERERLREIRAAKRERRAGRYRGLGRSPRT